MRTSYTEASEAAHPPRAEAELSIDAAIAYAVELHRDSKLEAAETIYRRILALVPAHADALHFLGVLCHQTGRHDEAIGYVEAAIAINPEFAGFNNNLGNIHVERGNLDAATRAYERAATLAPTNADIANNLGALYRAQDRDEEAEASYRRAIGLDERHINAHNNLGLLFAKRGQIKEAVQYYCHAITLMPENPDGRRLLGMAYYSLGKIEEAAEVFRQWLEQEPDQPMARHMYAACSGVGVPDRAADDYVEQMFDRFASSFEEQLQSKLAYKAPELVSGALTRQLPAPAKQLDILDAGCGTGLCGPLLAPWARSMVGVDLSGGMLERARPKRCYTALEKAELGAWLVDHPGRYDLVVSADTLVYFGPLEVVMQRTAAALRSGALFGFSVERADPTLAVEGYRINPHGRYSHTQAYLESMARQTGLRVLSLDEVALRTEGGEPVHGYVVVMRKP
ncbi:tetratricopeptide repeat protein [Niveibacterium sp. SC-1]|uniref:tetratricopeptide repeat protein n=1 Tax=Niveibacterium sp. SC-1 TaxID=3135646 RepID=UPI00311D5D74